MKNSFMANGLECELSALGINIILFESIIKCFNTNIGAELNYEHNDIANLFLLLESLIKKTKGNLENIEKLLII